METQLELGLRPVYKHGGRRPGAGRPKSGRRVGVPHRARPYHDRNHPVHVTWRFVPGLPSMRQRRLAGAVGRTVRAITMSNAARRTGFRIIHFSIMADHLHMIVEAGGKNTLMKGLRGLGTWIG